MANQDAMIGDAEDWPPVIKVIGIGGCGCTAIDGLREAGIKGAELIAADLDFEERPPAPGTKAIRIGVTLMHQPERESQDAEAVREALRGAAIVFIAAGMGGSAGTGASKAIASIAAELGALTVAVVTRPFELEGQARRERAEIAIRKLRGSVDALIAIPNEWLPGFAGAASPIDVALAMGAAAVGQAVLAICDVITAQRMFCVDFPDIKSLLRSKSVMGMGSGVSSAENRAVEAARQAVTSPLLHEISLERAQGLLLNVTGGDDVTLADLKDAASTVWMAGNEDMELVYGLVIDPRMVGTIRVTVIAAQSADDGYHP